MMFNIFLFGIGVLVGAVVMFLHFCTHSGCEDGCTSHDLEMATSIGTPLPHEPQVPEKRNALRVVALAKNADEWVSVLGITNKLTRISDDWRVRVSVLEAGRSKWQSCMIDVTIVDEDAPLDRDDMMALLFHSRKVYSIKELTHDDVPLPGGVR